MFPSALAAKEGTAAFQHETAIKVGPLQKRGATIEAWKPRIVSLTQHHLYYFVTREDERPAGAINLRGCRVRKCIPTAKEQFSKEANGNGPEHTFEVWTPQRQYFLAADTEELMSAWVETINGQIIEASMLQEPEFHDGWLYKRGKVNPAWKKRWILLTESQLYYYDTPAAPFPKGVIDLTGASASATTVKKVSGLMQGLLERAPLTGDHSTKDHAFHIEASTVRREGGTGRAVNVGNQGSGVGAVFDGLRGKPEPIDFELAGEDASESGRWLNQILTLISAANKRETQIKIEAMRTTSGAAGGGEMQSSTSPKANDASAARASGGGGDDEEVGPMDDVDLS